MISDVEKGTMTRSLTGLVPRQTIPGLVLTSLKAYCRWKGSAGWIGVHVDSSLNNASRGGRQGHVSCVMLPLMTQVPTSAVE